MMLADEGVVHVLESLEDLPGDDPNDGELATYIPHSSSRTLTSSSTIAFRLSGAQARQRFREFFKHFRLGNTFVYRDSLVRHLHREEFFVEVDLAHVQEYDDKLFNNLHDK